MDSSDSSDNEDTKNRRRVRRKSTSATKMALEFAAPFSMLKKRKSLAMSSAVKSEQDNRTNELLSLLKPLPARIKSSPVVNTLDPNYEQNRSHRLNKHEMRKSLPMLNAAMLARKVDNAGTGTAGESPDTQQYFIQQYMDHMPESFEDPYHVMNIPNQIFMTATDSLYEQASMMSKLNLSALETSISLDKWWTLIDLSRMRKTQLLRNRIAARNRLALEAKTLDEESIWGLKPLRYQLTAPYLKTSNGFSAAPAHPSMEFWRSLLKHVPLDFHVRQNWMAKDTNALKDSIRDNLVERKLFRIKSRTELLMKDCIQVKENELEDQRMEDMRAANNKEEEGKEVKRRGRPPRKSGRQKVFATITPTLFTLPNGITVRYKTNNAEIQEWCEKSSDAARKLKYAALVEEMRDEINWQSVSTKVTLRTKKNRSALDCYLAFKHEVDPTINGKRWTQQEARKLQGFVEKFGIHEIEKIAALIGNNRTVFQCFQRWKNTILKTLLMNWDPMKDAQLNELVASTGGNWKQVAFKLPDDHATKNRAMDRFKKNTNPILKAGQFSRIEDALLILTIEKLRAHIAREGHFGELIAYLPWRFETVWRDRAGNLFANFIVPWTIEEDKQLLELAETMNRDWRKISDTFKSFKNRKGCLTRWKILQKRLNNYGSVEAYHESYSMTRYNVFQYKHLNDILDLLKKIVELPFVRCEKIDPCKPPTEEELARMLIAFNRNIMRSAITSLTAYVEQRDYVWKDVVQKVNERQKTFDRRTFHRDLPQSMASAMHIRGVTLIPREEIQFQLTDYQEDVYKYYARFTRTKSLKRDASRPYIPTAYELCQMPEVKGICEPVKVEDMEILNARVTRRSNKRKRESTPEPELIDIAEDEDE